MNAQYDLDSDYLTCISERTMDKLKPFGDIPEVSLKIQIPCSSFCHLFLGKPN